MKKLSMVFASGLFASILLVSGCGSAVQDTAAVNPGSKTPDASAPAPAAVSIAFGREGGNIKPYTIIIDAQGKITSDYPSDCIKKGVVLDSAQLAALKTKVSQDSFNSLPAQIGSHLTMPDRASLFIQVMTDGKEKKVDLLSGTNAVFTDVLDSLNAAAVKKDCQI